MLPALIPAAAPDPGPRLPTPLQVLGLWVFAAVALSLASALVYVLANSGARSADPGASPLLTDPRWIALGTIVNELAVVSALALALWRFKPSWEEVLPLSRPSPSSVIGAVLLAFGLGPFAEAAGAIVQHVLKSEVTVADVVIAAARGPSTLTFAMVLVSLAVLPAVVEEAMFRGFATAAFSRRSRVVMVLIPSLLFGLFHFEPTQVAGTIVLGIAFGVARVLSGSLIPAMVAHGLYNAAVLLAVRYSDVGRDRNPELVPLLVGALVACAGLALLVWSRVNWLRPPDVQT
jgi:membrane protease YdiL (CAAX protease family)